MSFIQSLNQQFAIEDSITVNRGPGGFPAIHISNSWASACISLHGGQILSYQPKSANQDLLFLSPDTEYKFGVAIRGGVPVCWPWFGPATRSNATLKLPSHGFARNTVWRIEKTEIDENGFSRVVIVLNDDESTRELWPYKFQLKLSFLVGKSLSLELETSNTGEVAFEVTQALHSYFYVGDVSKCLVKGLGDISYIDKLDNGASKSQIGDLLIEDPVDRIYQAGTNVVYINDPVLNRQISVTSRANDSTVIWNPWKPLKDMSGDHFKNMLCIEAATLQEQNRKFEPGEIKSLVTEISIY